MQTVQFVDALRTGVVHIDNQHEALVEMINSLIEAQDQDSPPETISFVLEEMQKYVYVHFRDEEKYMQENGFAGLEAHRQIHQSFEDKVFELKNLYGEGETDLLEEVLGFLTSWLVHHIQGDDARMVKEVLASRR